jgi:phenylpyruvate tautomerase PptA (4-oxalocrotonate tautomerase family)
MPMIEFTCPENSITKPVQNKLMKALTDCLLKWEGAPADSAMAQAISWGFVYEQPTGTFYVAGKPIEEIHYRVLISIPEGVLDDERKAGLVAEVAELVSQHAGKEHDSFRTWCLIHEIIDGNWSAAGQIFRRSDIVKAVHTG